MENFKNHIKPFGILKKQVKQDPMAPKYIKPDGTKVIEQDCEIGKAVYEICPDGCLINRTYDKSDKLVLDYIRHRNFEIGHSFDEYGNQVYEFNFVYDEHNVLAKRTEIITDYFDNGKKSKETILKFPGEIKYENHFDETGKLLEKIEYRGSVKTYFNAEGKPVKREIDRGSGGVITENLE